MRGKRAGLRQRGVTPNKSKQGMRKHTVVYIIAQQRGSEGVDLTYIGFETTDLLFEEYTIYSTRVRNNGSTNGR